MFCFTPNTNQSIQYAPSLTRRLVATTESSKCMARLSEQTEQLGRVPMKSHHSNRLKATNYRGDVGEI